MHSRQLAKPTASLRLTMKLRPLRSFCMNARRSAAISLQAPQPRDSSRLSMWLMLRRIDSIFRFFSAHSSDQHTQPAREVAVEEDALPLPSDRPAAKDAQRQLEGKLAVHHEAQALAQLLHEGRRSAAISAKRPSHERARD